MPIYGDTANVASRGSTFASKYVANPNGSVATAWVETLNSLPQTVSGPCYTQDYSYGGGHGLNGCGCNLIYSAERSADWVTWRVNYEAWSQLPNDGYDGTAHYYGGYQAICNYDTHAYPWFAGYYSHLGRAVDGIPVAESTAWARINDDGDVVSEEVRWPSIPASVVAEAKAVSHLVEDEGARAALHRLIGLPGTGRVVIHHPTWSGGPSFTPFASYDVVDAPGGVVDARARTRHFRRDGSEITVPTFEARSDRKAR